MTHNLPAAVFPSDEITDLAQRYRRANSGAMAVVNRYGGKLEAQMKSLPPEFQARLFGLTETALSRAYGVAGATDRIVPLRGRRSHLALAGLTGAAGGFGGLPTALAELPISITVILHAIRDVAQARGFDPDALPTQRETLRIFGAGGPLTEDDGVNTSFIGARLTFTGPALSRMLGAVAPRLATALGQKLAAQTVPVLGAVAGAGLNIAYTSYYREMAEVRFALLVLGLSHGPDRVVAAFRNAVPAAPVVKA